MELSATVYSLFDTEYAYPGSTGRVQDTGGRVGPVAGWFPGWTDEPALTEYEVKAMFLYNFTKYEDWPADAFPNAAAPITIGVLGKYKFGGALPKAVK